METCLPIGARRTFISSILQHNQETELRLSDYGIPSDAVIVRLNYNSTSDGGLSPIELLNNPSERHSIPPVVRFYPRPVGEGPYQETSFCLMVTWIPTAKEDISWQSLIEAFHHFVIGRFNPAIITANTAIESRMGVLLTEFLETRFTKKHYKEHIKGKFLENAATYYYQLNVVLPALLSFADSPPLPEHINRVLNDLINNRNKLTHTGLPKKPITKDGAAELLCGALFGIHYLDLIKPILLKG